VGAYGKGDARERSPARHGASRVGGEGGLSRAKWASEHHEQVLRAVDGGGGSAGALPSRCSMYRLLCTSYCGMVCVRRGAQAVSAARAGLGWAAVLRMPLMRVARDQG
jgi:hypothetical protein